VNHSGKIRCFFLYLQIATIFFAVSCNQQKDPIYKAEELPVKLKATMDSVDRLLVHYDTVAPDSSLSLIIWSLRLLKYSGFPQKEIYYHLMLTEYYQYRKTDYNLALKHLTTAMEIFVKHPGPYLTNPYLFINVGNLLFNIRNYPHAAKYYRLANDLAVFRENAHAEMIALHNQSLVFRQLGSFDSARICLSLALQRISPADTPKIAQNATYVAELFQRSGNNDSASEYAGKTMDYLRTFRHHCLNCPSGKKNKACLDWLDLNERCLEVLMKVSRTDRNHAEFLKNYQTALGYAYDAGSVRAAARLHFESALMAFTEQDDRSAIVHGDSAIFLAGKMNDLLLMQEWLDTLSRMSMSKPRNSFTRKYIDQRASLSDSLDHIMASATFSEVQTLLTSMAAEQTIQRANADRKDKSRTISEMAIIISGLVLLTLLIGALSFTIFFQKRKLYIAYQSLTARIQDSISIEDKLAENKQLVSNAPAPLLEKFEILMREQKVFTEPDLNLAGLAERMDTNTTYLSQFFNNHYGVHFKDYLNDLRVKEACRMMSSPGHDQHTLDQILTMSGFNSKASFYSAFRKFTGMSPAAFRSLANSRR
jgi:AraC-like DNA-binding protein